MKKHRRGFIILAGCVLGALLTVWALRGVSTEPIDSYATCAADGNPISDTNPRTCRARQSVFLGPPEVLADASAPGSSLSTVEFELLVQGDPGGNYPRRQDVISTADDWHILWKAVHSGLSTQPPIIPVDFSTSDVVALTEGPQQTTGYNLKITAITASEAGTVVDVTESIPTVTCQVMYLPTNRYFLARTPKLRPPVSFRTTSRPRRCGAALGLDGEAGY
jgi:hypothetical protein